MYFITRLKSILQIFGLCNSRLFSRLRSDLGSDMETDAAGARADLV